LKKLVFGLTAPYKGTEMIIAFGCQKGVGKNTAARILDTELRCCCPGLRIKLTGMASLLKHIAYLLFKQYGLQTEIYYETFYQLKEVPLENISLSPRDIWIQLGNKMREIYPTVWIDALLHDTETDIIIITDLRYRNEAAILRAHNALLVKIDRNVPRGNDPAEVDLLNWTDWDYIVDNNKGIQNLGIQIDSLIKMILKKICPKGRK